MSKPCINMNMHIFFVPPVLPLLSVLCVDLIRKSGNKKRPRLLADLWPYNVNQMLYFLQNRPNVISYQSKYSEVNPTLDIPIRFL